MPERSADTRSQRISPTWPPPDRCQYMVEIARDTYQGCKLTIGHPGKCEAAR